MTLEAVLGDISPESLANMAGALHDRGATLLASAEPSARNWGRLYGFLSAEMEVAAFSRRQLS